MMDLESMSLWEQNTYTLLQTSLQAAVPLWALKLREWAWSRIHDRLEYLADEIASHGDNILFQSKKRGESARAFNALAEALAICSFVPGGVKLFGCHWEFQHPDIGADHRRLIKVLEALERLDPSRADKFRSKHGL